MFGISRSNGSTCGCERHHQSTLRRKVPHGGRLRGWIAKGEPTTGRPIICAARQDESTTLVGRPPRSGRLAPNHARVPGSAEQMRGGWGAGTSRQSRISDGSIGGLSEESRTPWCTRGTDTCSGAPYDRPRRGQMGVTARLSQCGQRRFLGRARVCHCPSWTADRCPGKIAGCGRWERARPVVSTSRGGKLPSGPFHASRATSRVAPWARLK